MLWLEKNLDRYRKIAIGFGAASLITAGIFKDFTLSFVEKCEAASIIYIFVCAAAFWWSTFLQRTLRPKVTIEQAMAATSILPDDNLAYVANKFLRRRYGRSVIDFRSYKHWRERNQFLCTCLIGSGRQLYGFFDVWPLNNEAGARLRSGDLKEQQITTTDIVRGEEVSRSNFIYIASIEACVINDYFEVLLIVELISLIKRCYPPRPNRMYLAFGVTTAGKNLLDRNEFLLTLPKELTTAKHDLWVLNEIGARKAIDRYSKHFPKVNDTEIG